MWCKQTQKQTKEQLFAQPVKKLSAGLKVAKSVTIIYKTLMGINREITQTPKLKILENIEQHIVVVVLADLKFLAKTITNVLNVIVSGVQ